MSKKKHPAAAEVPVYAAFRDASRHSCIRVRDNGSRVSYVPMDALETVVKSLPAKEFYQDYEPIPDYPVKRAAEIYLFSETSKEFSSEAKQHLERIVGDPAYAYDAAKFSSQPVLTKPKEPETMSTPETAGATATTSAAPAKTPAKKAPAKAPAKKAPAKTPAKKAAAAPAKAAKTPAKTAKGTVAKGAKAPATSGRIDRAAKLTLLVKENPKREGTKAHEAFEIYRKAKTVGDALDAGVPTGYLNFDVKAGFVKLG